MAVCDTAAARLNVAVRFTRPDVDFETGLILRYYVALQDSDLAAASEATGLALQ